MLYLELSEGPVNPDFPPPDAEGCCSGMTLGSWVAEIAEHLHICARGRLIQILPGLLGQSWLRQALYGDSSI